MELIEPPVDIVDRYADPDNEVFHACDAKECGAKSWYFVTIKGKELSFCGHHATKYEAKLLSMADFSPRDLRYKIGP